MSRYWFLKLRRMKKETGGLESSKWDSKIEEEEAAHERQQLLETLGCKQMIVVMEHRVQAKALPWTTQSCHDDNESIER